MKPTKEHAEKILELLSHGLVQGLGQPRPGEMCVEAAVCFALGLPHNDNPPCVGKEVRNYKIGLNDQKWLSNKDRANGMKELAIAQLGSNEIDQEKFKELIFIETQKQIVSLSFDYLKKKFRVPEHEKLKAFCLVEFNKEKLREEFKNYNYYNYYNYNYYYNYYDYYYYYNNYYNYDYYYYYYEKTFYNRVLTLSAKVGVDVLKQLNSPGCQWLDLCNK